MSFRLRRADRLKGREEVRKVITQGRKVSCFGAKLFYLENGRSGNRAAFTVIRKYGNAVRRNRSRRTSREAYRLYAPTLLSGYDLVILVFPGGDTLDIRMRQLYILFQKAGLSTETK